MLLEPSRAPPFWEGREQVHGSAARFLLQTEAETGRPHTAAAAAQRPRWGQQRGPARPHPHRTQLHQLLLFPGQTNRKVTPLIWKSPIKKRGRTDPSREPRPEKLWTPSQPSPRGETYPGKWKAASVFLGGRPCRAEGFCLGFLSSCALGPQRCTPHLLWAGTKCNTYSSP